MVVLGIGAVGGLGGCAAQVDVRGNVPDEEAVLAVQPGSFDREQVAELLGTPSTMGTFDEKTWYYIGAQTETTAFFDPDVIDQQVLMIKFDDGGIVQTMKLYGIEDGRVVTPVEDITPTYGRKLTILQQIFGNIGRFTELQGTGAAGGAPVPLPQPN
jgi:outer membrane protein assembly factor BamE (lipoprotein component of BamABCDE complex)